MSHAARFLVQSRYLAIALAASFLFGARVSAQVFHDPKRKTTVGFAVDLQAPPDAVAAIVKRVANDGVIRGTKIYAKETEISDAEFVSTSRAFTDPIGNGQAFYKIRTKALAPADFPSSNDVGTVTVRYIVGTISPERTRLRIDAIFISDGIHKRCPSDGSVEAAEYAEILTQVKAATAPPSERPSVKAATADTTGLQDTLAKELADLESARATEKTLQQQVKQLEFNTMGRVRSPSVPLKSAAYGHASTVVVLDKGEVVTVLATTKYWYRVRRTSGEEGWIYYVFLEPLQ
jgi:hypothetical protein